MNFTGFCFPFNLGGDDKNHVSGFKIGLLPSFPADRMLLCCYVISPGFVMECTISTEKMFENKPQVTIWVVKDPFLYGIGYNKRKLFRNSRDRAPSSTSPCVLSPPLPHASWACRELAFWARPQGQEYFCSQLRSLFGHSALQCLDEASVHCPNTPEVPFYSASGLSPSLFRGSHRTERQTLCFPSLPAWTLQAVGFRVHLFCVTTKPGHFRSLTGV